jgi:hypothetical protein
MHFCTPARIARLARFYDADHAIRRDEAVDIRGKNSSMVTYFRYKPAPHQWIFRERQAAVRLA